MAAPEVPTGFARYLTHPDFAVDAPGSIFEGETVESGQLVDLQIGLFEADGYPIEVDGYITGFLTNAVDGTTGIFEWRPSDDSYTPRMVTVTNTPPTGFQKDETVYKYYPISPGGNIVMNDAVAFDTEEEIIEHLNTAPGNPFLTYARIAKIIFVDVT